MRCFLLIPLEMNFKLTAIHRVVDDEIVFSRLVLTQKLAAMSKLYHKGSLACRVFLFF